MRILKRIFELVFIFILPLVFCFCSFKKEITNTYDSNNNLLTTDNNFTWDFPFNDFKDSNHYINKLNYNNSFNTNYVNHRGISVTRVNDHYNISGTYSYNGTTIYVLTGSMLRDTYYLYKINIINNNNNTITISKDGTSIISDNSYHYFLSNNNNNMYFVLNSSNYETTYNIDLYMNVINYNLFTYSLNDLNINWNSINELNAYNTYTESDIIEVYNSNKLSNEFTYNYTFWGKLFNDVLIDTLKFNDVFVVRFASSYIVLVIFMIFAYHLLIWPLDLLFRILFFKERL